jgi:hypothetical protein
MGFYETRYEKIPWRPLQIFNFKILINDNTEIAALRTSEVGTSLAPFSTDLKKYGLVRDIRKTFIHYIKVFLNNANLQYDDRAKSIIRFRFISEN